MQLSEELLARLGKEQEIHRGAIPVGMLLGIESLIPTMVRTGTVIYCRADAPDDFAYALARAMDEHQDLLQWSDLNSSYNVHTAWKAFDVHLHPGAEKYYRGSGRVK